jgi:hypothetical protein
MGCFKPCLLAWLLLLLADALGMMLPQFTVPELLLHGLLLVVLHQV